MGILCSFPEQTQFCRPLGAYWIVLSPTLLGQLDTLVPSALKANKFSGPPAFWSPARRFWVSLAPSQKKRVNFDICNRDDLHGYIVYWQCQFDTLSFPEQIQFCRPLGAYWIVLSPTLLGQLDTLVPSALKANKFSGPSAFWSPQTCLVPRTCAQFA